MSRLELGLITLFSFCILSGLVVFYNDIKSVKFKKEKITYCVFIGNFSQAKGSGGKYIYKVRNKNYEIMNANYQGIQYGEKFLISYEENEPTYAEIHFEKPVFVKGEKTRFKKVKVIDFKRKIFSDTYEVCYKYTVNFQDIIRWQQTKIDMSKVDTSKYFKLEYWTENPQRSILQID